MEIIEHFHLMDFFYHPEKFFLEGIILSCDCDFVLLFLFCLLPQ